MAKQCLVCQGSPFNMHDFEEQEECRFALDNGTLSPQAEMALLKFRIESAQEALYTDPPLVNTALLYLEGSLDSEVLDYARDAP